MFQDEPGDLILNKPVPFQLGGDNNGTFHVNLKLTEEEKKKLTDQTFFRVRKLFCRSLYSPVITAICR